MTQPATAPATPAALPSLDERVAAVNSELDAAFAASGIVPGADPGPTDAPAAEPTDALTDSVEVDVQAPPDATAPDAEAEARATERRARLAALSAKTRDQVDRKAALAAADRMQRDLAAAQARADAAEKAAAGRVDVSNLDEAGFFALAEEKGIKPENLSAWLQKAITSPHATAEAAALKATQSAYDPKLAALEARIAEQDRKIAAHEEQQAKHAADAEEQRATHAFLGMVSQSAARAPLAAKLLALDSEEFMEMASIAANRVPGQGPEALLDAVEDMLDGDGRKLAQKYTSLYGTAPPSQPSAPVQPTTRGAAKPNTVSNSLAQSRTALSDERDFAALTLEERAAILRRS